MLSETHFNKRNQKLLLSQFTSLNPNWKMFTSESQAKVHSTIIPKMKTRKFMKSKLNKLMGIMNTKENQARGNL